MGRAGYDWITVDLEHGTFSHQILPDIFRALELGGTLPFARLARTASEDIKRSLDAGAKGLIFPMIESGEQLKQAVSQALYPPEGTRGVGYCRANLYGKEFGNYVENEANDIIIIAQIEHINAVGALDEILAVSRLNAIIVGPYDLSASMGITAQFDQPEFTNVMDQIQKKAGEHGVPMGLHLVQPDQNLLREKIADGYQFIAYATDAVFLYNCAECPRL